MQSVKMAYLASLPSKQSSPCYSSKSTPDRPYGGAKPFRPVDENGREPFADGLEVGSLYLAASIPADVFFGRREHRF